MIPIAGMKHVVCVLHSILVVQAGGLFDGFKAVDFVEEIEHYS